MQKLKNNDTRPKIYWFFIKEKRVDEKVENSISGAMLDEFKRKRLGGGEKKIFFSPYFSRPLPLHFFSYSQSFVLNSSNMTPGIEFNFPPSQQHHRQLHLFTCHLTY